jgi:NAD(P)-dependent dehydrogenase (short-subunit alcohol dehydrogenase family)
MSDKVILITGAASGIGLTTAKQFIEEGAVVIAADINTGALEEHATALGGNYRPMTLDVASNEQIESAAAEVARDYGKLDALINNAAVAKMAELEELEEDVFDFEFAVNLKGPMLLVKNFAKLLRKSDNGSVVNIASVAAIREVPGHYLYSAAKVALDKFTRDSARAVPGIRHNCIEPGIIDTPILDQAYGDMAPAVREVAARCPVSRVGKPEDIANAIQFLCSDKATYINGATLIVDGGISASTNSPF